MQIQIYVCDDPRAMLFLLSELPDDCEILYQTPDDTPETGTIIRCDCHPLVIDPAVTLSTFAGKHIVIARQPDYPRL